MKNSLVLFIALFVVIGCNFDLTHKRTVIANKPASEQLNDTYHQFINEHDFSASLTGSDVNGNGIRDDIDLFINMMKIDVTYRNAIRQSARNIQSILSYDFSIPSEKNSRLANQIASRHNHLLACDTLIKAYREDRRALSDLLISLTLNTKARSEAYLQYNDLLELNNSLSAKEEECLIAPQG